MSDIIKQDIISMLYSDPKKTTLSQTDINRLLSFPVNIVATVLLDIYEHVEDIYVRGRAFRAILSLPNFDRVTFLIDIFDRSPVEWKYNVCYELRFFQDYRASEKLCSVLLGDPTPDLRYVAAESLANFDDIATIHALEFAQDHDMDEDYEGVPISETAKWSLNKIRSRIGKSETI